MWLSSTQILNEILLGFLIWYRLVDGCFIQPISRNARLFHQKPKSIILKMTQFFYIHCIFEAIQDVNVIIFRELP